VVDLKLVYRSAAQTAMAIASIDLLAKLARDRAVIALHQT
jgi:hypothetical protein